MPSIPSDREDGLSRRRLLGLCAVSVGVGAAGSYAAATKPWESERKPICDALPLVTDPTAWPVPDYDSAGTNHAPARSAPRGKLGRAWRTEWDVEDFGRPVVADGRVYIAGYEGFRGRDVVTAFGLADGTQRWRTEMEREQTTELSVVGDYLLYDGSSRKYGQGVVAFTAADGTLRWSAATDRVWHSWPVVVDDYLYFCEHSVRHDETVLAAYSAGDGKECWTRRFDLKEGRTLVTDGRRLYLGGDGVFAVDRENGEHRWRADAKDFTIARAVRDGRLFVTSLDGWLAAFDAKTGERLWQKESENDSTGGTDYESVVVTSNALLVRERVRSAYPDRVRAFDPKTGDVLWTLSPDEEGPLLDRF